MGVSSKRIYVVDHAAGLLHLLAHPEQAPKDQPLPYESNGYRRIAESAGYRES